MNYFGIEQCGCRTGVGTWNVRNIIIYALNRRSSQVEVMLEELYVVIFGVETWNLRNLIIYAMDIRSS